MRKRGGREEVLGGGVALHLLQDYFFFNSFKMEIIKMSERKRTLIKRGKKSLVKLYILHFFKVLIWHMAQSACMHLVYINKY